MLLIPSVRRETFRFHDNSKPVAPGYVKNKPLALQRDRFTCQGGFFSVSLGKHFDKSVSPNSLEYSRYLIPHNIDGNHENNDLANLITLCPFCHSVFHAGCVSNANEMKVIFYPWLSQAQINLMVNLLISCQANKESEYSDTAKLLYEHFDSHFMYADSKKFFEQGMSEASNTGSSLVSLFYKSPQAYARRGELLAGLRFFPVEDMFIEAGAAWVDEWPNEAEWSRLSEIWVEQNSSDKQVGVEWDDQAN